MAITLCAGILRNPDHFLARPDRSFDWLEPIRKGKGHYMLQVRPSASALSEQPASVTLPVVRMEGTSSGPTDIISGPLQSTPVNIVTERREQFW
jgi:hypothetical protein